MEKIRFNLAVKDILLDIDNYRFLPGTAKTQADCINGMLENEVIYGIMNLAEDIAKKGLMFDPIIVFEIDGEGNGWTVLEGNRRITALKLLNDPSLCPDSHKQKKLQKLQSDHPSNIPQTIDVITTAKKEDIYEYILKRHTGPDKGRGLNPWRALQKDIFNAKLGRQTKYHLSFQVIEKFSNKITDQSTFNITNLQRLLNDKDVIKSLGLSVKGKVLTIPQEAEKNLEKIVVDIVKGLKVNKIYDKNKRKKYLEKNIGIPYIIAFVPKIKKSTRKKKLTSTASPAKTLTTKRATIIPKDYDVFVPTKYEKPHNIMQELQKINCNTCVCAGAITFRTFIELSIRHYMRKHHLKTKDAKGHDYSLEKLIKDACNHLVQKTHISKNEAMLVLNNELTISDFNDFVHNPKAWPTKDDLISYWIAIEEILQACWEK